MKVVMLDAPAEMLEERRRKGHDRFDEMWEGVLHMVPPPSDWHQQFGTELLLVVAPAAKLRGLIATYESGLFRPGSEGKDYRQPDIVVTRPEQRTKAGAEAAEVVFEILSPSDESHEKLPFYAARGVKEAFLIDPHTRAIELYLLQGGELVLATATDGVHRSEVLGISFETLDGPKLRIRSKAGEVIV